jgi:hypothetical protein
MQRANVALVTGSSIDSGFETSLLLAKNGYYTYATMRNLDKSTRIKETAKKATNSDSPYAVSKKVSEGVSSAFDMANASIPSQVAEVILRAIKSEKPVTRNFVGKDAAAIRERRKNSTDFELESWIKASMLEQKGFTSKSSPWSSIAILLSISNKFYSKIIDVIVRREL